VRISDSPSLFFAGMAGSCVPVVVAHGEGRAVFEDAAGIEAVQSLIALQYTDHVGDATERFPLNPNGSPRGIAGLTTPDGRFTIMMPHPERCFRGVQNTWRSMVTESPGAWQRMFGNARVRVG
jgi:phosphoribosylformylglycinamidine synthase